MPFKSPAIAYILVLVVLTLLSFSGSGSSGSNGVSSSLAFAAPVPVDLAVRVGVDERDAPYHAPHRMPGCNANPYLRGCNYPVHSPQYPPKDKPAPKFNYPPKNKGKGKGKPPSLEEEEFKEKDVAQTTVEETVEKKDMAQTAVVNKREYLAPPRHNDCDKVPWEHMCKNAKHHPMSKPKSKVKPTTKTKGKKKKKPPTLDEEQSFTERMIKARAAAFGKKVVAVIEARYRNKGCNVPWERDCKNPYKGPTLPPKNEKPVYGKGKKKPPVDEREELEHMPETITDVAAGEVTIGAVDEAALTTREEEK